MTTSLKKISRTFLKNFSSKVLEKHFYKVFFKGDISKNNQPFYKQLYIKQMKILILYDYLSQKNIENFPEKLFLEGSRKTIIKTHFSNI